LLSSFTNRGQCKESRELREARLLSSERHFLPISSPSLLTPKVFHNGNNSRNAHGRASAPYHDALKEQLLVPKPGKLSSLRHSRN
jgi:hypothetical protein